MLKKRQQYIKPQMHVCRLMKEQRLLVTSPPVNVGGNVEPFIPDDQDTDLTGE